MTPSVPGRWDDMLEQSRNDPGGFMEAAKLMESTSCC